MSSTQQTVNPLLSKVKLPGRVFQLPSLGAFYSNGELDISVKEGEMHIHPMTALTEINLKNPDLLFNGTALEAVVAECAPGIKKPLELYGRDIDALLFFLRLTTYGSEYRIEVTHDCENAKKHSYVVDLESLAASMKKLDPTLIEVKRVVIVDGQFKVVTRPMRFSDVVKLFHQSEGKKELTQDDIKKIAMSNLLSMIEKVDDTSDPKFIEEWLKTLTTPSINKITEAASQLNDWGPDQVVKLKCRDCGEEMRVELPLNPVSFFSE
jgi:hypothetical protein